MNRRSCDVLIVGGGPAGLSAAIALRRQGADVMVAESLAPPIDKACGEGLMPDARLDLAKLGIELGREHGARFDGILFADASRRVQSAARFAGGDGLGVRRLKLHALMIERAEQAGVRLRFNTRVELNPGAPPAVNGETCRYQYLIGADGQSSRVRRWAGLESGTVLSRRIGLRRHYAIEPWSSSVEIYWGALGQAYLTPVGDNEICAAVITRHAGVSFDQVIAGIPFLAGKLSRLQPQSRERGSITLTRVLRRVAAANVALIGDASGSADAITGEGLAMGFRQAVLLAEALGTAGLARYNSGHRAILRLPRAMARAMLLMDRSHFLRNRTLQMLSDRPAIFQKMLDVHLGEESIARFVTCYGLEMGWRVLAPSPA